MDYGVTSIKVIYKKSLKDLKNSSKKSSIYDMHRGYPLPKNPDGENENERKSD